MVKKTLYIIAYDISDDRRRTRVAKELERYGTRANYSVFECTLSSTEFYKLVARLEKIIRLKQDSLIFYRSCLNCFAHTHRIGRDYILPPTVIGI